MSNDNNCDNMDPTSTEKYFDKVFGSKDLDTLLSKEFETQEGRLIAYLFVSRVLPDLMPLSLKLRIAKYNLKYRAIMNALKIDVANFRIVSAKQSDKHFEAPFQLDIITKTGKIIASVHYYLVPPIEPTARPELHINLIQGKKDATKELEELTTALGENWRIYFVKKILELAQTHNLKPIGELPRRNWIFSDASISLTEYHRVLRQYIRTYLKAGLPVEHIAVTNVHEIIKPKIEQNLLNRKEKQEKHKMAKRDTHVK